MTYMITGIRKENTRALQRALLPFCAYTEKQILEFVNDPMCVTTNNKKSKKRFIKVDAFIALYKETPVEYVCLALNAPSQELRELQKIFPFLSHPDMRYLLRETFFIHKDRFYLRINKEGEESVHPYSLPLSDCIKISEPTKMQKYVVFRSIASSSVDAVVDVTTQELAGSLVAVDGSLIETAALRYEKTYRVDEKGRYWKLVKQEKLPFFTGYLEGQIRTRYGLIDRPKQGLSNIVIDSYFPYFLCKYSGDYAAIRAGEKIPNSAVAISPLISEALHVRRLPLLQLCRILGYTLEEIKKLLLQVKKKEINFIFVGAGGTNMNTAAWLLELCDMTSVYGLFANTSIFEKESIEFSNMLRFPLSSSRYAESTTHARKLTLIAPLVKKLSKKEPTLHDHFLTFSEDGRAYQAHSSCFEQGVIKKNTVMYGAPAVEDRNNLAGGGPLICATHADTSCSVWLNPKQDENIQVETYGIIQLGSFFVNQLKLAISLLELLGSDQDLLEPDKHIMDYTFDDNTNTTADKNYHWQTAKHVTIMTPTEVAALRVR